MLSTRKVFGLVLLVGGLVVLGIAYQDSRDLVDRTHELLTGEYRDRTRQMMLGGAIATVLGFVALVVPGRGVHGA